MEGFNIMWVDALLVLAFALSRETISHLLQFLIFSCQRVLFNSKKGQSGSKIGCFRSIFSFFGSLLNNVLVPLAWFIEFSAVCIVGYYVRWRERGSDPLFVLFWITTALCLLWMMTKIASYTRECLHTAFLRRFAAKAMKDELSSVPKNAEQEELHKLFMESYSSSAYTFASFFQTVFNVALSVVMFLVCANNFGIDTRGWWGALGVSGFIIGLSAQDLLANMFASIFILTENMYKIGDNLQVLTSSGVVTKINMRSTSLRGSNGEIIIIPNTTITRNPVSIQDPENTNCLQKTVTWKISSAKFLQVMHFRNDKFSLIVSKYPSLDFKQSSFTVVDDDFVTLQARVRLSPCKEWLVKQKYHSKVASGKDEEVKNILAIISECMSLCFMDLRVAMQQLIDGSGSDSNVHQIVQGSIAAKYTLHSIQQQESKKKKEKQSAPVQEEHIKLHIEE